MQELKLGKYRHYKNKLYEVVGVANHSETLEKVVVYKALYASEEFAENALWVRPLEMFTETIEIDGKMIPRFQHVEE